jgi:hypothetical protein
LAPGLGDEAPISVEPVQERPFPNEYPASGPADDEPFRLEQADGLADGLVSCAVALDQFTFGRQLVPRCERMNDRSGVAFRAARVESAVPQAKAS